jgi:hypothetical protein
VGRGVIAPTHSRWGRVTASRPAALYTRGNDPWLLLYRRLGGPQSRSGHRICKKNPLPLPGIEPRSCCKILRHRTSGFTSHPKEGVLRIFIALRNPSPRPGSNVVPLGPATSTLTTTPPRRLPRSVLKKVPHSSPLFLSAMCG